MIRHGILAALFALSVSAATGGILLLSAQRSTARAASLPWTGAEASELYVRENDCPIEVEKETLTVRVPDFPDLAEGGEPYLSRMETEYVFYNPTEEAVTMDLLLPTADACGYASLSEGNEPIDVSSDGVAIEPVSRYLYSDAGIGGDRLCDSKRDDAFYEPASVLTHTAYSFSRPKDAPKGYVHLYLAYKPQKTRVIFDGSPRVAIENGYAHAMWQTDGETGSAGFYSVGAPAECVRIFESEDAAGQRTVEREFGSETRTTTFAGFAEELRPDPCAISETDWYNGFVDMLNAKTSYGVVLVPLSWFGESCFTRFYSYSVTVAPHGRVTHTVKTPVYPTVDLLAVKYRYAYRLSDAQRWADFGTFEAHLVTQYHLSDSSLQFEACDDGYRFTRTGLPIGELEFTLTEQPRSSAPYNLFDEGTFTPALTIAIVLLGSAVTAAIVVATVFLVRSRRVHAREQTHFSMGKSEEGTVDLPPPDGSGEGDDSEKRE